MIINCIQAGADLLGPALERWIYKKYKIRKFGDNQTNRQRNKQRIQKLRPLYPLWIVGGAGQFAHRQTEKQASRQRNHKQAENSKTEATLSSVDRRGSGPIMVTYHTSPNSLTYQYILSTFTHHGFIAILFNTVWGNLAKLYGTCI